MRKLFKLFTMKTSLIIAHFVAAIITTAIFLTIYATVQQAFRSTANDPQIQIARDLANDITKGKAVDAVLSKDTIDLTQSLALFTEIFDRNGKLLQSTGFINGALPQPPSGVIDFINANNEDVLTWQPQSDVRMAMVFEKVSSPVGGFVAVGRSLKETEVRESNLLKMVGIAWGLCMVAIVVHLLIQIYLSKRTAK
jgi:hypothetical protein